MVFTAVLNVPFLIIVVQVYLNIEFWGTYNKIFRLEGKKVGPGNMNLNIKNNYEGFL